MALEMRPSDFYRLLVVHFHLWNSNPRIRVGEKRRQLFHGDPSVHYLLWDFQVLHLRFLMFVLPSLYPAGAHHRTVHSGASSCRLATCPTLSTITV